MIYKKSLHVKKVTQLCINTTYSLPKIFWKQHELVKLEIVPKKKWGIRNDICVAIEKKKTCVLQAVIFIIFV